MVVSRKSEISLGVILLVLILLPTIKDSSFLSIDNLKDVAINSSYVFISAIGMMLIILSGDIDVSVGAILAIAGAVAGTLAKAGYPIPVIMLAAVLTGMVLGFINGLLVTGFRIQAIIATLGTMSIFRGMFIIITKGKWVTTLPDNILSFGRGSFIGIPIPILMAIVIFIISSFFLTYTKKGRHIYCIGSNSEAARLAGIHVAKTRLLVFILNGALLGFSSLIFIGRYGSIQSNTGIGFEMVVISAVIVGGASIMGGAGTVVGTLAGSILITIISTVLIFFNISAFWEQAVQGAFILFAVLYYTVIASKPKKVRS